MPAPEDAVDALTDGRITVTNRGDEAATVIASGPDGVVTRVFEVTKREDGWWPDSYTDCSN